MDELFFPPQKTTDRRLSGIVSSRNWLLLVWARVGPAAAPSAALSGLCLHPPPPAPSSTTHAGVLPGKATTTRVGRVCGRRETCLLLLSAGRWRQGRQAGKSPPGRHFGAASFKPFLPRLSWRMPFGAGLRLSSRERASDAAPRNAGERLREEEEQQQRESD